MRRNPCELEIELFCLGLTIDGSCELERDARGLYRNRAGLGSGLEIVLSGEPPVGTEVWVNAPVEEPFAHDSPYRLEKDRGAYRIRDARTGEIYAVRVPAAPAWYERETSTGVPMRSIGVLQGTYLGIYVGPVCRFWSDDLQCRFCATGLNVGPPEPKSVQAVVETARAAKEESGVTFVHLNTGYQNGAAYRLVRPYVEALKRDVGVLVGVQVSPEGTTDELDRLIAARADHFSFCFEYFDPESFSTFCPGKEQHLGQQRFFDALEHCQRRMPKGACSGEIIAGNEPLEATRAAIDYITGLGAFPTVCVFRPLAGTAMADWPPPDYDSMRGIMKHVWDRCRKKGIPIGLAPNLSVSLVVQPTDAAYLADHTWRDRVYSTRNRLFKRVLAPLFSRRMKPA
ncbi:MAG: radical SAM protein [Planctomycetota bacterium]